MLWAAVLPFVLRWQGASKIVHTDAYKQMHRYALQHEHMFSRFRIQSHTVQLSRVDNKIISQTSVQ